MSYEALQDYRTALVNGISGLEERLSRSSFVQPSSYSFIFVILSRPGQKL